MTLCRPRPKIGHDFDWSCQIPNTAFCSRCGLKAVLDVRSGWRYQLIDGSVVKKPPACLPPPEVVKFKPPPKLRARRGGRKRKRQRL